MTAKQIIQQRQKFWTNKSVDDEVFCNSVAQEICNNINLRKEVVERPELLIEMLFYVVDKEKNAMPFFLNDVQKDFISKLTQAKEDFKNGVIHEINIIILKGRQQGFTTLITAYQLACTILNTNFEGLTVADEVDNAQTIFDNKSKYVYSRLPELIKPTEKYNNRRELRFSKLNSYWQVAVADKDLGRSRTINFLHGSECAFWKGGISNVQAGLGEALTRNCIKIWESTANGFNDFRELWQSGTCINLFYEWWRTSEYSIDFVTQEQTESFKTAISYAGTDDEKKWIAERLKWLRKDKGLADEQLHWYLLKYNSYIDKQLIKQEYPCSADEAFLSSGRPVFNNSKVIERIENLKGIEHKKQGFDVIYNNPELRDKIIAYDETNNGLIKIFEQPEKHVNYVIGADTAGDGSDAYTAYVLRNDTSKQVASLYMPLNSADCTPFVEQLFCLGHYYNNALIAPEINFNLQVVAELQRLKYKRIYVRQKYDDYRKPVETKYGWKTDGNTRPMIISIFAEIIEHDIDFILDADLLTECLSFEYDDKGRPDARSGAHDDRLFAAMIAYKAREQQSYKHANEMRTIVMHEDIVEDYQQANEDTKKLMRERFGGVPVIRT